MTKQALGWSVPVGFWQGVPIRVHAALILAAVGLLAVQWGWVAGLGPEPAASLRGGLVMAVLTLGVAAIAYGLPWLAQCAALERPFQTVRSICLMPWGAAYEWRGDVPIGYRYQFYAIGIAANFCVLSLAWLSLAVWFHPGQDQLWLCLYPWYPILPARMNLEQSLLMAFVWMNAVQLFARVLPVVPMDLGHLLDDWSKQQFTWATPAQRLSALLALALGSIAALVVSFYMTAPYVDGTTLSLGVWPLIAGLTLAFSARVHYAQQLGEAQASKRGSGAAHPAAYNAILRRNPQTGRLEMLALEPQDPLDSDARAASSKEWRTWKHPSAHDSADADGDSTDEEAAWSDDSSSEDGQWENWMDDHRASREQARRDQAAAEEALLDDLLLKVSNSGIHSLTDQEREVLNRVSQLFRNRRKLKL
jgi:hypothetical protein